MTLSSMTGFARTQGTWENYHWVWEIRSVNGKNLDVRCRIPPGLDAMDQKIRGLMKKNFARGSVNVHLQMTRESGESQVIINEDVLGKLVSLSKQVAAQHDLPVPAVDNLLSIRDVVEIRDDEEDDDFIAKRDKALEASLLEAVEAMKTARAEEGAATHTMLTAILDEIKGYVLQAEKVAEEQPELLKNRFLEKVNRLLDDQKGLDQDRLHQEVVILATKADVKEETDRLKAHIEAARKLLSTNGPVGRKLDFLMQEFNREANTLCSKSSDIALTDMGLSLKTAIDQLKEQIQNIE